MTHLRRCLTSMWQRVLQHSEPQTYIVYELALGVLNLLNSKRFAVKLQIHIITYMYMQTHICICIYLGIFIPKRPVRCCNVCLVIKQTVFCVLLALTIVQFILFNHCKYLFFKFLQYRWRTDIQTLVHSFLFIYIFFVYKHFYLTFISTYSDNGYLYDRFHISTIMCFANYNCKIYIILVQTYKVFVCI